MNVTTGPGGTVNITTMTVNYQEVYNHPAPPSYDESRFTLGTPPPPNPDEEASAIASAVRAAVVAADHASASHSKGRRAGSAEVFSAAEAYEASVLGKRAREKQKAAHSTHRRKYQKKAKGRTLIMMIVMMLVI